MFSITKVFNKGLDEKDKKERLLKRLKSLEGKNEKQLKAVKHQGKKQLDVIKIQGENKLKTIEEDEKIVYLRKQIYP